MAFTASVGCPRCGSEKLKQYKTTTAMGYGLFLLGLMGGAVSLIAGLTVVGLIIAVPGAAISFGMVFLALFCTARMGKCKKCRWAWRIG